MKSNDIFAVRYCILFRTEGLNVDGVITDLENKGAEIMDVLEDYVELSDGTKITTVLLSSGFGDYMKIKLDYNLLEDREHKYHYWPMKSMTEKLTAEKMLEEIQ